MLKDPKLQFERSNIHKSGKYSGNKQNSVEICPKTNSKFNWNFPDRTDFSEFCEIKI